MKGKRGGLMPKADIRINVGADTGVSTDILRRDLEVISKRLRAQSVPRVSVGIDFSRTQRNFQTQLQNVVRSLNLQANVNLNPTTGSSSSGGGSKNKTPAINPKTSTDIALMEQKVKKVELAFQKLSTAPRNVANSVVHLQSKLDALKNAKTPEKQKEAFDKLNDSLKVTNAYIKNLKSEQNNATKFEIQKANLERQIRKYIENNPNIARSELGIKLNSLLYGFEHGRVNEQNINQYRLAFANIRDEAAKTGNEGQNMWDRLTGKFADYTRFLIVSSSLALLRKSLRDMVEAVKEIDIQMTELKKVTDETDTTYQRFLNNAGDRAIKLGATIADVVRSTADFAKMGYNIEQASTLGDVAILYKNVADGIGDISEASGSIISVLKAFKLETSDAMRVVDVFNEISNKYAVTSHDMGLAMADAGAALATAGSSLEESVALWTAMNEVIQDGSKSSAALRTIVARMRNTAGKLEEMGEDAEGAAESVTKLQQEILKLTGVNIMIDENTFKKPFQILQEMSKVWDKISDKERADVVRLLGGTRQQATFSALMQNFSTAEKVLADSAYAAGRQYCQCVQKCA